MPYKFGSEIPSEQILEPISLPFSVFNSPEDHFLDISPLAPRLPVFDTLRFNVWSKRLKESLNNAYVREIFVRNELAALTDGSHVLDAGCGDQKYRKYCEHLRYSSQDFAQYTVDAKTMLGTSGIGGEHGYNYGNLDYKGDIWNINEMNSSFDAV